MPAHTTPRNSSLPALPPELGRLQSQDGGGRVVGSGWREPTAVGEQPTVVEG